MNPEKLLERLGAPTCVFCDKLNTKEHLDIHFYFGTSHNGESVVGRPCTDICERAMMDRSQSWLRI